MNLISTIAPHMIVAPPWNLNNSAAKYLGQAHPKKMSEVRGLTFPFWGHVLTQSSNELAGPAQGFIHVGLHQIDGVPTCIANHVHYNQPK